MHHHQEIILTDYGHSSSRDDYPSRGYRYVTLLLLPWLDVKKFFSCKNYCFGAWHIFLFNIVIEMAMVDRDYSDHPSGGS